MKNNSSLILVPATALLSVKELLLLFSFLFSQRYSIHVQTYISLYVISILNICIFFASVIPPKFKTCKMLFLKESPLPAFSATHFLSLKTPTLNLFCTLPETSVLFLHVFRLAQIGAYSVHGLSLLFHLTLDWKMVSCWYRVSFFFIVVVVGFFFFLLQLQHLEVPRDVAAVATPDPYPTAPGQRSNLHSGPVHCSQILNPLCYSRNSIWHLKKLYFVLCMDIWASVYPVLTVRQ